ncbi:MULTISPECIES: hypothetical protein [unclassified Azospirillum]|uniref:hypothetical protein n=1 Tax=unclassified Azospirillum TaxID=2630922 RepID=UPI000B7770D3|nr:MULTISPECIES: hypothetical protein [unclassified Azospirillum]
MVVTFPKAGGYSTDYKHANSVDDMAERCASVGYIVQIFLALQSGQGFPKLFIDILYILLCSLFGKSIQISDI